MYIKDGSPQDYNHTESDPIIYAWGWLGNKVESSSKWKTDLEKKAIISRIKALCKTNSMERYRGIHECEICGEGLGNGSIKISFRGKIYCCPNAVDHYIENHDYCPDDIVIEAINKGVVLSELDLNLDFSVDGTMEELDAKRKKLKEAAVMKGLML